MLLEIRLSLPGTMYEVKRSGKNNYGYFLNDGESTQQKTQQDHMLPGSYPPPKRISS